MPGIETKIQENHSREQHCNLVICTLVLLPSSSWLAFPSAGELKQLLHGVPLVMLLASSTTTSGEDR